MQQKENETSTLNEAPISAPKELVQLNVKIPSEKKDAIIKRATGEYGMTVPDFIVHKCLKEETIQKGKNLEEPSKENIPEVKNQDLEKDALEELVRRQKDQILTLTEEKQELKNLQVIQSKTPTKAENTVDFIVSPELKSAISAIEIFRKEKGLKPFNELLEELLIHWAEELYTNFGFSDNTGMKYSDFKDVLSIEKKFNLSIGNSKIEVKK